MRFMNPFNHANVAWFFNSAWLLRCRRELNRFHVATTDVAGAQRSVLEEIVRRNRDTEFGREFGFGEIQTPEQFQRRVPVTDYEFYAQRIERIATGEQRNVLTVDPVKLLEPTSGTSGGEKLIPYTRSLRGQFQRAIAAWIADLMTHRPAVRGGRAYWSITPAFGSHRESPGGIPIGFDADTEYLGLWDRVFARRVMAVPAVCSKLQDIDNFRYCTLLHLLAAKDLSLISVWSPTFLTTLISLLPQWQDRLCNDVARGTFSPPRDLEVVNGIVDRNFRPRKNRHRAQQLKAILSSELSLSEKLGQLWPQLALISCWASAAAANYVDRVRELFPKVEIQPKGLIATEGFVSFPLVGRAAPALAIRSHFFEFQSVNGMDRDSHENQCLMANELAVGQHYRVLLTTGGGLYRYQLYDEVQVVGFENDCPLLRFVGSGQYASDLVGEKISEPFVAAVLQQLFADLNLKVDFSMLVPVQNDTIGTHEKTHMLKEALPNYRLYLQGKFTESRLLIDKLGPMLEKALRANPHYSYARELGQLAPLEVQVLTQEQPNAWERYEREMVRRGIKLGNIKAKSIDGCLSWCNVFDESKSGTT